MDEAARALLRAVADTAKASGPAFAVREEPRRVEIEPTAADGLSVTVRVDDDAVIVGLGGHGADPAGGRAEQWQRRFPREDDPDDDADALALAHDLVAAALWGRALLRVEHVVAKGRQGRPSDAEGVRYTKGRQGRPSDAEGVRYTQGRQEGKPWRTTVCFGAPGRWLTFDRQGGGLRAPWARVRVEEQRNSGPPPRPIDEARLRPLPWAPWAGIRGEGPPEPPPVELPVNGELDLHSFSPKEVKALVLETIAQHRARGLLALRIVHGKGVGNLRRTVHALLDRHPGVASYRLGGHGEGSWGATLVELRPPTDEA